MNANLVTPTNSDNELLEPMLLAENIDEYIGLHAWDIPRIKEAEAFWDSSTVVLDQAGTITEIRECPDNLVVLTTIFGCLPENEAEVRSLLSTHGFELFEY